MSDRISVTVRRPGHESSTVHVRLEGPDQSWKREAGLQIATVSTPSGREIYRFDVAGGMATAVQTAAEIAFRDAVPKP